MFSKAGADKVAAPFCLAIVGKFSHGRPPLEEIRKVFGDQVMVGLLDYRHVLLRCALEADFI